MQYVIKANDTIEAPQVQYINRVHQTEVKDNFPVIHPLYVNDICEGSVYVLGFLNHGALWGTNWCPFLRVISSKPSSQNLQDDIKRRYARISYSHPIGRIVHGNNEAQFEVRLADSNDLQCDIQKEIDRRVSLGIPKTYASRFKYKAYNDRWWLSYDEWIKDNQPPNIESWQQQKERAGRAFDNALLSYLIDNPGIGASLFN